MGYIGRYFVNSLYSITDDINTNDSAVLSSAAAAYQLNKKIAAINTTLNYDLIKTRLNVRKFLRSKALNSSIIVVEPFTLLPITVDGETKLYYTETEVEINVVSSLYSGTALQSGTDYKIFLCYLKDSNTFKFVVATASSITSTYPYSTVIGGFHTECVAVGTISGHPLSGLLQSSIIPNSVWTIHFRPISEPNGMAYVDAINAWVDIYLQSGTGTSTKSAYNATHTVSRASDYHVDDLRAVKKRLLTDTEFSIVAEGSNQKTAIYGSVDQTTVGGHKDTAGRRMVSNYGMEEMCGYLWQWIDNPSPNGGGNWGSELVSGKGSLYGLSYRLLVGGSWVHSSYCGSFCRHGNNPRSAVNNAHGARGCSGLQP